MSMNKLNNHLATIALGLAVLGCTTQAADNENGSSGQVTKLPVDVKVVRASALVQEESVAGSVLANREVTVTSGKRDSDQVVYECPEQVLSDAQHCLTGQVECFRD